MPQILPDDQITKGINYLTSKQREVFNVLYPLGEDYAKYHRHHVEPVHLFISGRGGKSKSHFVKVIYNTISKTLFHHCKEPEKPNVLLLGPAGIPGVNIGGTTIHSGLGIKPGTKLLGVNHRYKASLRNSLSEVKLLIIDELSLVSSDLWTDVESILGEIFIMIPEKTFAGLSVTTIFDLLLLPPVRGNLTFSQFSDKDSLKHLLGLQLLHLFKYAELPEVVRQNDKLFIDWLNKVR